MLTVITEKSLNKKCAEFSFSNESFSIINLNIRRICHILNYVLPTYIRNSISSGPNLAKSIPNVAKDATDYIPNQYQSSMFVNPTCSNEVKNIIMALKDSSNGYDGIKSNILKVTCNSFIAPLTHY